MNYVQAEVNRSQPVLLHPPQLSIPKMLSGANAFEISDIQEERNREPGPNKAQNITMGHCYIASTTCHRINSPETGSIGTYAPVWDSGSFRGLSVLSLGKGETPRKPLRSPLLPPLPALLHQERLRAFPVL